MDRDAGGSNNKIKTEWKLNEEKLSPLELSRDQIEAKLPAVDKSVLCRHVQPLILIQLNAPRSQQRWQAY